MRHRVTDAGTAAAARKRWSCWTWVLAAACVAIAAVSCYPFGEWPRPMQARERAWRLTTECPWFATAGTRWDHVRGAYMPHSGTLFRTYTGALTEGESDRVASQQRQSLADAGWEITDQGPSEFRAVLRDHLPSGKPTPGQEWRITYVLAWRGQRLAAAVQWGAHGVDEFGSQRFWERWPTERDRMLRAR